VGYGRQKVPFAFDLAEPAGTELVTECLKDGLILNSPQPSTIRFMPALIVTKHDIDDMFEILRGALQKIIGNIH